MSTKITCPDLSIVIPVHNEEENLRPLTSEILEVLGSSPIQFEIVLVNDGSTDSSGKIMNGIALANELIRCVHFESRCGQTSALDAGFRACRAPLIATMDADLQYDPRDIAKLIEALQEDNLDLVCGWRFRRRDPITKRVSGQIANSVRNFFTNDGIHDTGCTLKIFRKECLDKINLREGFHRFFPALFTMRGFRIGEEKVNHRHRLKGKSKYTIGNRLFVSIRDLWMVKRLEKKR